MSAITAHTIRAAAPVADARAVSAASTSSSSATPMRCTARGVSVSFRNNKAFAGSRSGLSASRVTSVRAATSAAPVAMSGNKEALMKVELKSKTGADFTKLRDLLAEGEWELADNETRALLIEISGEDAQDREWVYFSEIQFIPEEDLLTMDALWMAASDGKYGYSVQRAIWVQGGKQYGPFFKKIDWTHGENNAYRKWPEEFKWKKDAAKGHLPLTNALRGTQLIEAIFNHPAFNKSSGSDGDDSDGTKPKWMKKTKTEFSF